MATGGCWPFGWGVGRGDFEPMKHGAAVAIDPTPRVRARPPADRSAKRRHLVKRNTQNRPREPTHGTAVFRAWDKLPSLGELVEWMNKFIHRTELVLAAKPSVEAWPLFHIDRRS